MAERIVQSEDISDIRRALREQGSVIVGIVQQVNSVDKRLDTVHGDIVKFRKLFDDFLEKDVKAKNLQLAQTRLIEIRQKLDREFGFYNELRRRATGILQAADLSLVKRDTIATTTDDLMLSAPKYWLAPVLVAVSSWLLDNQDLATRAVAEALQRDDERSSLFFALLMRRAKRVKSYQVWLDRYFGMQDPENLDRQVIVVLNALVNGVFGVETYTQCLERINAWVQELTDKSGYIDKQRQRWEDGIRSKISSLSDGNYPSLKQYSPTWKNLAEVLQEAKGHQDIFNYFDRVFQGEIARATKFEDEVDRLLSLLASKFDDDELPLSKDEQLQSLIVKYDGDRALADDEIKQQKEVFEDKISFTQVLTNAAINPELTEASLATQRFAIALSREWIISAHQDFTAKNIQKVPISIDIAIDDWKGKSEDGANELQLVSDVQSHYERRKEEDLSKVKIKPWVWAYLVIGSLLFLSNLFAKEKNYFLMLVGAGGGVSYFVAKKQNDATKLTIQSHYDTSCQKTQQILKGTLAEIVDWRRDYAISAQKSGMVTELLEDITPEQYVLNPHGSARRLLTK